MKANLDKLSTEHQTLSADDRHWHLINIISCEIVLGSVYKIIGTAKKIFLF